AVVLEQAVEAAVAGREGEVTATDLVAALRAMGDAQAASGDGWTVPAPEGAGILVRVRLAPDTPLRGVRAFIIVNTAGRIGEVTATEPSLDDIQADGFDADFALRLLTPAEPHAIEKAIRSAGD